MQTLRSYMRGSQQIGAPRLGHRHLSKSMQKTSPETRHNRLSGSRTSRHMYRGISLSVSHLHRSLAKHSVLLSTEAMSKSFGGSGRHDHI